MSRLRLLSGLLGLLFLVPGVGHAQSVFSPCQSNASNSATVVLPASVSAAMGPSDDGLDGGTAPDSIAVYTPDGTCVGVTAWSASGGVTLSVAGTGPFVSAGMTATDSLKYRVYDASRGVVEEAIVEYKDCSRVSSALQPLCRDSGGYKRNAVYVPTALSSYSLPLHVTGSPGRDAGDAGWRLVGPPTASTIRAEDLRIGGEPPTFDLADGDMLLRWDDEASGNAPSGAYEGLSATDALQPGRGYALYLFDEPPYSLDPAIKIDVAGSPKVRSADSVTVDHLSRSARWHLLANPYPSGYDLSALSDLPANGFQATVQRYDATIGSWILGTQSKTSLSKWQAFFVERTNARAGRGATALTFSPEGRTADVPFVGSKTAASSSSSARRAVLGLSLRVTTARGDTIGHDRAAQVVFDDRASADWDVFDATKRTPLASNYALLIPRGRSRGDSLRNKAVESRPWPSSTQSIPLRLRTHNLDGETAVLSPTRWTLPPSWTARLIDRHRNDTYPLDSNATVSLPLRADSTDNDPRFTLKVAPSDAALSLDLASFRGALKDETVHLQWEVGHSDATTTFHVERRTVRDTTGTRPGSGWTDVGVVQQPASTGPTTTYRFTDENLPYEAVRYDYRLRRAATDGRVQYSEPVQVERSAVRRPTLQQPFPNPARTRATIRYAVPRTQHLRIELYDLLGRRVRVLTDEQKQAGRHQILLDTSHLPSGVYFYRLDAENATMTRKITVVH